MFYRKVLSLAAAFLLAVSTLGVASAKVNDNNENKQASLQSIEPLNIAILIQDDVVAQVGNELGVTRDFIRSLPEGSRSVANVPPQNWSSGSPVNSTPIAASSRCLAMV